MNNDFKYRLIQLATFAAALFLLFPGGALAQLGEMEIPALHSTDTIVRHLGYTFQYNEKHEQAAWVAYALTQEETKKLFERSDDFIPDPKVHTGSAIQEDYARSGYDRGHLAPAADMGWSEQSMQESFYFSNMSPQNPSFNRGLWSKLEAQVRRWAKEYQVLFVVTGPVLEENLPTIGPSQVSVPNLYYKVLLDTAGPSPRAIGFVMRNEGSKESLQNFAVSIDSVEHLTGIDFYPELPDEKEKQLEHTVCMECWNWAGRGLRGHEDLRR
jgi:endonuclease G